MKAILAALAAAVVLAAGPADQAAPEIQATVTPKQATVAIVMKL